MATSDLKATRQGFRELVAHQTGTIVPGAANAITARLIEEAGFEAVYVTGAGISNSYLGLPDVGFLSLPELTAHVSAIANVVDLPIIVDADTGFGNSLNAWHTVRALERAGASAIQLEDQAFPKKCGHFDGKVTIEPGEMVEKIHACVDAREDPGLQIIARTDARSTHGIEEACRRARLYRAAGADIVFVEAPEDRDEVVYISKEVPGPKVINIVHGGRTPEITRNELAELGFAIVLHANLPLLVSISAVRSALASLRDTGTSLGGPPLATWDERQAIVRKDVLDDMSAGYLARSLETLEGF